MDAETEKRCPHCGKTKTADEFGFRWEGSKYPNSWCKECKSAMQRDKWRNTPMKRIKAPSVPLIEQGEMRTELYRRNEREMAKRMKTV